MHFIQSQCTYIRRLKTDSILYLQLNHCSERVRDVDPGGVANLYWLWDWVGMAPRMGPMSPVRAHCYYLQSSHTESQNETLTDQSDNSNLSLNKPLTSHRLSPTARGKNLLRTF